MKYHILHAFLNFSLWCFFEDNVCDPPSSTRLEYFNRRTTQTGAKFMIFSRRCSSSISDTVPATRNSHNELRWFYISVFYMNILKSPSRGRMVNWQRKQHRQDALQYSNKLVQEQGGLLQCCYEWQTQNLESGNR